jgi:tetratricopeptide (TPR) repeat protein
MRIAIRILSLAALVCCVSVAARAQNVGQLRGELWGPDGNGIPDVTLNLERIDAGGENTYTIVSDDRGDWVYLSVAQGDYEVQFQIGDKLYQTLIKIGSGENPVRLDLARMEYEGYEFDRESGIQQRMVRDINELSTTMPVIRAPRNDEERKAREAAEANADAVREAFTAGREALNAGDYETAINQFSIAAEGDATQHIIIGNLGLAYERAEMWEQAAAAYERAQSLAGLAGLPPEEANYYPQLTLAHAMTGNVQLAMRNAERAAVVNPAEAAVSFYNVGAVLTNQGDIEGGVAAFERAIELDPTAPEAYYQIAIAKLGSDTTIPEAVPLLEKYLDLAPTGPNAEAAQGLLDFARSQ